jgi:hypothetical protein
LSECPGHDWRLRAADGLVAAAAVGSYVVVMVCVTFNRKEWFDTVGYALPGANYVERGTLSMPQLGSQMGLDRFWLLSAPWIAVGPIPWMKAFGAGRISNLVGLVFLGLVNLAILTWAIRRVLRLRSWGLPALVALPFLLHRAALSEYYNQRYTTLACGLLTLAFLPTSRGRPWWQWLAAGLLPLVHPAMLPASVLWLAAELLDRSPWLRPSDGTRAPSIPWLGIAAYVGGMVLTAAWYGRLGPLREQFLPHLRFGNYRALSPLIGLLDIPAAPIPRLPSLALNFGIVGLALTLMAAGLSRSLRHRVGPVLLPALVIALILPYDALRGFRYYYFFLMGLGPCLLGVFASGRARRLVCGMAVLLALPNLAISAWLDLKRPDLTTTAQGSRFVVEHTRPGDRIVLGPPFVLVSAPPTLPGDRTAPRVVPMDYYLDPFDPATFIRDIRAHCDVYIGEEEWFYRPVWIRDRGEPLFPRFDITTFDFRGQRVIVARARP